MDGARVVPAPPQSQPTVREMEAHRTEPCVRHAYEERGRNADQKRLEAQDHVVDAASVDSAFFCEHDPDSEACADLARAQAGWLA